MSARDIPRHGCRVLYRPDGARIFCVPTPKATPSMSMKHRRGNREVKKPKQNKPKIMTSASPFATSPPKAKGAKSK